MTDVIIDVDVSSMDMDVRLSEAIDAFVEMQDSYSGRQPDELDLMVRTGLGPAGRRLKHLIFQSREMADAFCDFWRVRSGR
ncbi:hypothetical protein [Hyphomonas sp.]|uniref:hypothetical protein n=1 Tax=Hyphomonas sp. TaxID=87 RepID=UPI00391911E1